MKILAYIALIMGIILLLIVGIGAAEDAVFLTDSNSTREAYSISPAGNTSNERISLIENKTEMLIHPISEDGYNYSGKEEGLSAFQGVDEVILDLQVIKTTRVSVRTNGKQGDGGSYEPSITSDGRYVAFYSWSTNLVNKDTNGVRDIFVHDRATGETRRVSVRTNGVEGDSHSYDSSISSDGHYVAFESDATNLVNGDTNGVSDIFVHDRQTGETRRVSVRTNGKQGDDHSSHPFISSDGRFVAYDSAATNLVNGDTNGVSDIFVHDREAGETRRVSVRTNGKQGDSSSLFPSVSSDGRYVAFASDATNLVNGDTNGLVNVYVHDRETGKTSCVSVRTNGKQGDNKSNNPSISSDGRYVAFDSAASNLVNGDTNGVKDIFVAELST